MERGGVQIIGVDSDWAVTYPEVEPVILTSTIKSLNNTVFNLVQNTMEGRFNAQFIGNLENGGVELAPFHNFEDQISDDLRAELQEIRELIISGQIEFFPDFQY